MSPPAERARRGFTLVEVLVAVVILATAFTIVWMTFSVSLDGWRRGEQQLDRLHHGDFVMEQLVGALRSAAYFRNKPSAYGFWLDNRGQHDELSWVTASTAFMKPDDPLAHGLHRLWVGIADNEDGDPAFAVRAFAHLDEEVDKDDVDPWFISSRVQGLSCRTWNAEEETWDDEWEDTNTIPSIVELKLILAPVEKYGPPIEIVRLVEIPLGPAVTGAVTAAVGGTGGQPGAGGGEGTGGQGGQPQQGGAGAGGGAGGPQGGGGRIGEIEGR